MKLVFLSDNMNFSGGRKLYFEYVQYLRTQKHDVKLLIQEQRGALSEMLDITIVKDFSPKNIPQCDIIVATTPREVEKAYNAKKGTVVHFCQGLEITDLEQRINGLVTPQKYAGSGLINRIKLAKKRRSWAKKKIRIEKVYSLPTKLITVSKHLKEELEERYNRTVALCTNGIRQDIFYHLPEIKWGNFSKANPLQIVNIGPRKVTFKGIETTLKAIKILKQKGLPIKFIRIAPKILDYERKNSDVDSFYENIPSEQLANILRSSHIYISNSTEGEGFGLPALEALSSGTIAVLSSISSYKNFSEIENFAMFVPEGDADATAETVEKTYNMAIDNICEIRNNALKVAAELSFDKSCRKFENILKLIHNQ